MTKQAATNSQAPTGQQGGIATSTEQEARSLLRMCRRDTYLPPDAVPAALLLFRYLEADEYKEELGEPEFDGIVNSAEMAIFLAKKLLEIS